MKVLVVLSSLLAIVASSEFCHTQVFNTCNDHATNPSTSPLLPDCNAKYGNFDHMETDLQTYANTQIEASFEFLLMSAHFGNYQADREGFKKLYRKLSDRAWEDAIDIIKFITKRGGKMNFNAHPKNKKFGEQTKVTDVNELTSLAKALDTQKQLAIEALNIHTRAQEHKDQDASVAHYMEEKFIEPQADCVRKIAGHISDFKKLLTDKTVSPVSIFLFDEILSKTL